MLQSPNGPVRTIPPERQTLYYVGMAVSVVGLLMFLSTFVTFLWHFGDFTDFDARARSNGFRAFGGIVMLIVGGGIMRYAAAGAAGSGLKLDPQQARKDLEPWARMSGGMLGDVINEAGIELGARPAGSELPFDEKLRRLHGLYQDGIVSEEEYQRKKQELLDKH